MKFNILKMNKLGDCYYFVFYFFDSIFLIDMIANGLEEEVRALMPFKDKTALKTVGYSEFFDYFENINTLEKTIELIKQNSRRYAKRQNTWFKKFGTGKTFSEWNDSSIFEYTENSLLL